MSVTVVEGLTKNQVKQIIRITKKKELAGRTALQGLLYQSNKKFLFVTDGFTAVTWTLDKIVEDCLPKEDVRISYQSLNAWVANASAKDILKWDDLLAMGKPEQVPEMWDIIDKYSCYAPQEKVARLNPFLFAEVLPLFDSRVDLRLASEYPNTTPAVRLFADESHLSISFKQQAIIMGVKK